MSFTPTPLKPSALMSPRDARRSLFMAGIGLATLGASFLYAPWSQTGPILCPFRLFTGLPCPGCGLTRSFCAVAHGDLRQAFTYHLFGPLLVLLLLGGIPLLLVEGITRRRSALLSTALFSRRGGYIAATLLFGYHLVRLVWMAVSGNLWTGMNHSLLASAFHWVSGWLNYG